MQHREGGCFFESLQENFSNITVDFQRDFKFQESVEKFFQDTKRKNRKYLQFYFMFKTGKALKTMGCRGVFRQSKSIFIYNLNLYKIHN